MKGKLLEKLRRRFVLHVTKAPRFRVYLILIRRKTANVMFLLWRFLEGWVSAKPIRHNDHFIVTRANFIQRVNMATRILKKIFSDFIKFTFHNSSIFLFFCSFQNPLFFKQEIPSLRKIINSNQNHDSSQNASFRYTLSSDICKSCVKVLITHAPMIFTKYATSTPKTFYFYNIYINTRAYLIANI